MTGSMPWRTMNPLVAGVRRGSMIHDNFSLTRRQQSRTGFTLASPSTRTSNLRTRSSKSSTSHPSDHFQIFAVNELTTHLKQKNWIVLHKNPPWGSTWVDVVKESAETVVASALVAAWENNKETVAIAKTTIRNFIGACFLEHFPFEYGIQRRNIVVVESRDPWNFFCLESCSSRFPVSRPDLIQYPWKPLRTRKSTSGD